MEEKKCMELDERSMIVEQARLEKEKKRRKNRRKKRIIWAAAFVAAAGGALYFFWGRSIGTGQTEAVTIEASAGQEILYARLDSVRGNEIAYTVAEETAAQSGQPGGERLSDGESAAGGITADDVTAGKEKLPGENQPPAAAFAQRDETNGSQGGTEDGTDLSGSRQKGVNSGEAGQEGVIPEGAGQEGENPGEAGQAETKKAGTSGEGFPYGGVWYGLTEETGAGLIPVGTDVITGLGAVTTFSRLQAGDYVALVMEGTGDERQIAAVYILG